MSKLLLDSSESSDEEVIQIKVNEDFAQRYDNWRRKEEIQKLKDKYGTNLDVLSDDEQEFVSGSDDSQDSDDSDHSVTDQQVFDQNFFKVYSALKSKNPIIYDKNAKFFDKNSTEDNSGQEVVNEKKDKKMTLKDYHIKLIKEKKGITEEDLRSSKSIEDKSNGYYEELNQIKNEFKAALNSDEEDGDEELLKGKTKPVKSPEEQTPNFLDDDNRNDDLDLSFLKNFWSSDKKLEESEQFLKDYIINKRYIERTDKESELYVKPELERADNDSEDDDRLNNGLLTMDDINKSNDIDVKVSDYHFEEGNATAVKRYPRDIESIRDMNTAEQKALKRSEAKERKKKEKERELKRLRQMKREELKQKLKKLQEISGNERMDFNDLDLNVILDEEQEFDAEKYDRKMKTLFGNDYYDITDNNEKKPEFEHIPEIDDLDFEDKETSNGLSNVESNQKSAKTNKMLDKKQKKIKRNMEEIGIFEDLIGGDLPTRFKYRTVEPNDFGLTDEEILFSDEIDLNKWCSVKKMSQYREENEEKYDKKSYLNKANNINLKRKILKSYFERKHEQKSDDKVDTNEDNDEDENIEVKEDNEPKRKKRKRKHKKSNQFTIELIVPKESKEEEKNDETLEKSKTIDKKAMKRNKYKKFRKQKNQKNDSNDSPYPGVSVDRLKAYGLSNRKIKKMKHKNKK